jgi:hypothetical protein
MFQHSIIFGITLLCYSCDRVYRRYHLGLRNCHMAYNVPAQDHFGIFNLNLLVTAIMAIM